MLCWTYPKKKLGRGHFTQSFTNSLESRHHFLESPWVSFEDRWLRNDRFLPYVWLYVVTFAPWLRWTRLLTINMMTILYYSIFYLLCCLLALFDLSLSQAEAAMKNAWSRLTVPEPVPLPLFYRGREPRHKWAGRLHLSNFHTTGASIIWRKRNWKRWHEKNDEVMLVCFSWNWKQFLQILSQTLEAQLAGQPELCDVIGNRKISCDEISSSHIVFDWL